MWEQLKGWAVNRMVRDAVRPWEDAGRAWTALISRSEWRDPGDRAAVWMVVEGLERALRTAEEAVRKARGTAADPALRRALNETAYALASTMEALDAQVVPQVEKRVGSPPKG